MVNYIVEKRSIQLFVLGLLPIVLFAVDLDISIDKTEFYQGEVLPVHLSVNTTGLNDYLINLHPWTETYCKFVVFKDGESVSFLHSNSLIGGASLGRIVAGDKVTKIPLSPTLNMDLSEAGEYQLEVQLVDVFVSSVGVKHDANTFKRATENLREILNFKVVESNESTALISNQSWIDNLKSHDPDVRDDALRVLAGTRMDQIADVIFSESISNRGLSNGFYALARMNTEHSINLLGRAVMEGAPWAVEAALHQIGNFYILSLEEVVKSRLESDDSRILEEAKRVLERLEYANANNIIDKRFNSPEFSGSVSKKMNPHEIEVIDSINRPKELVSSIRDNNDEIDKVDAQKWLSIAILGGLLFMLLCAVGLLLRRKKN